MDAYLWTWLILSVLGFLLARWGGVLAVAVLMIVISPIWWVAWALIHTDHCDDTTYGSAHYNTC